MISITELWCKNRDRNHDLRYNKPKTATEIKPIVVWNVTRRCNLRCIHCYSNSSDKNHHSELKTSEAKDLICDLASFGIPCLLFSGGEPLMRKDIFELLDCAKEHNLPTAISTNGTLIDNNVASKLRDRGIRYVGISLDGFSETNDAFRGVHGTFEKVRNAFNYLRKHNVNYGLRFTLSKYNLKSLSKILEFVEEFKIKRTCFYHLVPVGRGADIKHLVPDHSEIREALDKVIAWAERLSSTNSDYEILTVDNHCDNIYLYLKATSRLSENTIPQNEAVAEVIPSLCKGGIGRVELRNLPPPTPPYKRGHTEDPPSNERGARILELIRKNGGARFSSGVGIACIDWAGDVHPDQFWQECKLGNIRGKKFSEIWTENKMLNDLRNRLPLIEGRCKRCRWLELCGGGLRSRAYAYSGNPWASDPGCYLSDDEISKRNSL